MGVIIQAVSYWMFTLLSCMVVQPVMSMRTKDDFLYTVINVTFAEVLAGTALALLVPFMLNAIRRGGRKLCEMRKRTVEIQASSSGDEDEPRPVQDEPPASPA